MSDLATWANVAQQYMRDTVLNPQGTVAQARVTKTPIVIKPLDKRFHAMYTPGADIQSEMDKIAMDPAVRESLKALFPTEKGVIQVQPYAAQDSPTLRHEQFHNVVDRGGIEDQVSALIPYISSDVRKKILGSKTYGEEGSYYGADRVAGEEGAAFDLSEGTASAKLVNELTRMLSKGGKAEQVKQLRRLTK